MAYTVQNLISDAYKDAGIIGLGRQFEPEDLEIGLIQLNAILDHLFSIKANYATISQSVTFTGGENYTVGLSTDSPDIVVTSIPERIDTIVLLRNGVRYVCTSINAGVYFTRTMDSEDTDIPTAFYYERTSPVSTIRFYDGMPVGAGQLIYKQPLVDVTANIDLTNFPRAVKPYLLKELAYKLSIKEGFDGTALKIQSNQYFDSYIQSTYQGQSYIRDMSIDADPCGRYNIYKDE